VRYIAPAIALCTAALLLAIPLRAAAQELPPIRVLLDEQATLQTVGGELSWSSDGQALGSTSGEVNVGRSGETVVVRIGGTQRYARRLVATPVRDYASFNGRRYRGRLEFFAGKAGGCVALNVLALEDYLPGVIPREMPAGWAAEALRAQAVAARTYAVARMAVNREASYDVVATEGDQVYRGLDGEDERTTQAVRDTAGQILTYDGYPIVAYFSSSSGGYTRDGGEPYLRPVPSPEPGAPYASWSFELSESELSELAGARGVSLGAITGVEARYNADSGHLDELIVQGTTGAVSFSGPELRRYVGRDVMRSTLAQVEPLGQATAAAPLELTPNDAVDISAPAAAAVLAWETVALESYARPWVTADGMPAALKMRGLYAYNGQNLMLCNHQVHAVSSEQLVEPAELPAAASAPLARREGFGGQISGLRVTGSGYGHGRGLSQWGAKQMAEDGADYQAILHHYYTGVELVKWNGSLARPGAELAGEFYQPFGYDGVNR